MDLVRIADSAEVEIERLLKHVAESGMDDFVSIYSRLIVHVWCKLEYKELVAPQANAELIKSISEIERDLLRIAQKFSRIDPALVRALHFGSGTGLPDIADAIAKIADSLQSTRQYILINADGGPKRGRPRKYKSLQMAILIALVYELLTGQKAKSSRDRITDEHHPFVDLLDKILICLNLKEPDISAKYIADLAIPRARALLDAGTDSVSPEWFK